MFGLIKKTHSFIMEEKDVTTVLGIINQSCRYDTYRVGSCGWADEPKKWFVMFHATDKQYGNIMGNLMMIGSVNIELRPGGKVDLVFRRGS